MGDLTTSDMASQGGLLPNSIGSMSMPTEGLVFTKGFLDKIVSGEKHMIVKARPYKISGKRYLLITKDRAYGLIRLSMPTEIGVKEFKEFYDLHKISEAARKKNWPGKKKFHAYKIIELRLFAEPVPIEIENAGITAHGIKINAKGSFSTFELSKAEADDFIALGAWLKFILKKAKPWIRKTLRFITGPVWAIHELKDLPDTIEEFAKTFPPGKFEIERDTDLPSAIDAAVKLAKKLSGVEIDNKQIAKILKQIPKMLERIEQYIDAVGVLEDDGVVRVEEVKDVESDHS